MPPKKPKSVLQRVTGSEAFGTGSVAFGTGSGAARLALKESGLGGSSLVDSSPLDSSLLNSNLMAPCILNVAMCTSRSEGSGSNNPRVVGRASTGSEAFGTISAIAASPG